MIIDHYLDVPHDLGIAPVGLLGHLCECDAESIGFENPRWLGIQDEGNS